MSNAATNSTPDDVCQTLSQGERRRIEWTGYVFVAFFTVPFFLFNILPVLFGGYVAFTEWSIIGSPEWIGIENFREAFADEWVINTFKNALLYGLIIVPGVSICGLTAALFVNQNWPLSSIARTLFFAPYVVSATVIGLIWVWLLDTQFGLINHYLGYLGIPNIEWLTSTEWSLVGVSIASIWWDMGLAFILFLAALQDIPKDLTEAATVDGAGRFQRLFFVTLPMMRPVISMVVTLQMISTLRIFSQVYVMTNGGPAGSSDSPIHYIYKAAIVRHAFGYASAIAIILFLVIITVTIVLRFIVRERG
ncbi:MAG: sugar ABC transporter permease [Proteobacteria bacterium]|nr:sugar ABC transporter permease [Pseudomonadota bacterium]